MAKESSHCRPFFLFVRKAVQLVYPKIKVFGTENLPEEACIAVGNHSQMHGPIAAELYYPRPRLTWCIAQMQVLKEVPAYAYQDFWSGKPKWCRWFFKIMSYVIAPISSSVFNNAAVIPVYHDNRVITTFKLTVKALENGQDVIIFPEKLEKRNHIVYQFQENFVDVAKLYYKRTGKKAAFVPMYLAPRLHELHIGGDERPVEALAPRHARPVFMLAVARVRQQVYPVPCGLEVTRELRHALNGVDGAVPLVDE